MAVSVFSVASSFKDNQKDVVRYEKQYKSVLMTPRDVFLYVERLHGQVCS